MFIAGETSLAKRDTLLEFTKYLGGTWNSRAVVPFLLDGTITLVARGSLYVKSCAGTVPQDRSQWQSLRARCYHMELLDKRLVLDSYFTVYAP
jgi:hypothetical protein